MEFPKISGTKVRSLGKLQKAVEAAKSEGKYFRIHLEGKDISVTPKKIAALAIKLSRMSEESRAIKLENLSKIQQKLGIKSLQKEIDQLSKQSLKNSPSNQYNPLLEKRKASALNKIRYETAHGLRKTAASIRSLFMRMKKRSSTGFGEPLNNLKDLKEKLKTGNSSLSPYALATLLGFKMSGDEIKIELEKVPTRVNRGVVLHGEYELDPDRFENELGLSDDVMLSETPFSEAFSSNAGVWQGYSIGTHSMMVVRMFDQHLSKRFDKSNIVPKDHFRIFLMLHDIGKGLAVKEEGLIETKERKRKELLYCRQAIDALAENEIISRETSNIFKALLSDVTIGKFLQKKITLPQAVEELKKAMSDNQVSCTPLEFFKLARLFHLADASAYKALRAIPGLFEVNEEGKVRHAKITGSAGEELKKLKVNFLKPRPYLEKLNELENLLKDL